MAGKSTYEKPAWNCCTPMGDSGSRFLRWNAHGMVSHFRQTSDENSINVKFHNTSIHHHLEFNNYHNFVLADVSKNALALASTKTLMVTHFGSGEAEHEWTMSMRKSEYMKAICVSEQFIAIATSKRNIRILSLCGTQRQVFSIPGAVHAITAYGDALAVFFYRQLPLPQDQCLEVMLMKVTMRSLIPAQQCDFSPIKVALEKDASLAWTGFSEEGTLCVYDTHGNLMCLKNGYAMNWVYVANLHKNMPEDVQTYFIISISDLHEQIRCVPCMKSRFPCASSTSLLQVKKFSQPLCGDVENVPKTKLEHSFVLANIQTSLLAALMQVRNVSSEYRDSRKTQVDALFKLFNLGVENGNECMALDAAQLIPSLKTTEALIKYAERNQLDRLLPKLKKLLEEQTQNTENNHLVFLGTLLLPETSCETRREPIKLCPLKVSTDRESIEQAKLEVAQRNQALFQTSSTCENNPVEQHEELMHSPEPSRNRSAIVDLEQSVLSDLPNIDSTDTLADVANPFKLLERNKRKLDANDVLIKRKKFFG